MIAVVWVIFYYFCSSIYEKSFLSTLKTSCSHPGKYLQKSHMNAFKDQISNYFKIANMMVQINV